jgi:hypothetical protein
MLLVLLTITSLRFENASHREHNRGMKNRDELISAIYEFFMCGCLTLVTFLIAKALGTHFVTFYTKYRCKILFASIALTLSLAIGASCDLLKYSGVLSHYFNNPDF